MEDYEADWRDDSDDVSETLPCPNCSADVYEDADQCPSCGEYIVFGRESSAWDGKPAWWVLLGFIGIIAVIVALSGF